MFMRKPSDWYERTPEQQREWQNQQRAIEDAEYNQRQAEQEHQNEMARARREATRQREEMGAENMMLSQENDDLKRVLTVAEQCLGVNGVEAVIAELNRRFRPDRTEVQYEEEQRDAHD